MFSRMQRWMIHAANHRTCFGFGIVLIVVHLVLVAERVYRYRHFSGWIVTARATGTVQYIIFTILTFHCVECSPLFVIYNNSVVPRKKKKKLAVAPSEDFFF